MSNDRPSADLDCFVGVKTETDIRLNGWAVIPFGELVFCFVWLQVLLKEQEQSLNRLGQLKDYDAKLAKVRQQLEKQRLEV